MVPTPTTEPTRRALLRTGGAALATGLAGGSAGCLAGLPPLGDRQTYGRVDAPPAADPGYRRWLPDPAALDDGRSHYGFGHQHPAPVDGSEPEEYLGRRALSVPRLDYFGVGYDDYGGLVDCPFGTVVEASFDRADVARTLTESGYEPDGSHRGYDLFARSDGPRRAAVRDGVVVWASDWVHERPDVELLVDTGAGEHRRYHEAREPFARLSEVVGAGRMVISGPGVATRPTPRRSVPTPSASGTTRSTRSSPWCSPKGASRRPTDSNARSRTSTA